MNRYNPNFRSANATVLILPKDDYSFSIGEVKPFKNDKTIEGGDTVEQHGVRTSLTVKGGEFDGKSIPLSFYLNKEEGWGMSKQFIMAALGYPINKAGENKYNEDCDASPEAFDFSYDPDTNEIGAGWKKVQGAMVNAGVASKPNKNNAAQINQTFRWEPFGTPLV